MIRKEYLMATMKSNRTETKKFANAYETYFRALEKAQKQVPDSLLKDFQSIDEATFNPDVTRTIQQCAKELFRLNELCKKTHSAGFINAFVSKEAFEDLINEAYVICTDTLY